MALYIYLLVITDHAIMVSSCHHIIIELLMIHNSESHTSNCHSNISMLTMKFFDIYAKVGSDFFLVLYKFCFISCCQVVNDSNH